MTNLSLGTIEVFGLPAAVEAADVALKAADVKLIGYETTDGMGMVAVKVEGQVSAVQSAVAAARAAASKITRVFATSVIPRPSGQLEPVVLTAVTVGLDKPVVEPTDPAAPVAAEPVEVPVAAPSVPAPVEVVAEPQPGAAGKPAAAPAPRTTTAARAAASRPRAARPRRPSDPSSPSK